MGGQVTIQGHNIETDSNQPNVHVSGLWEEAGEPGEKP